MKAASGKIVLNENISVFLFRLLIDNKKCPGRTKSQMILK